MGRYERRKGATFEREIANAFREVFPDARRGIGQSRSAGEVPDVDGTPFWIECKRGKSCSVHAAMAQAVNAEQEHRAGKGQHASRRTPVAVMRRDGEDALVVMSLEDFLQLVQHGT